MQTLALRDYSDWPKGEGLCGPYGAGKDMKTFKGGFALVHQVVKQNEGLSGAQSDQQTFYALKEIRIRDEGQCAMVQREVDNLRKVKHANILEMVDAFYVSDPRIVFIVTQPWAPLSLEILLRNALQGKFERWHDMPNSRTWRSIISQCITGVEYLHTGLIKPIKHKDLKPHNILLHVGADPYFVRPIIADFGISKEWEENCTTDNRGTAQFKAPEQLKQGRSMLKSDIWALGCCFSLILPLLPGSNIKLLELWEIVIGPVGGSGRNKEKNPGFSNNLDSVMEMLRRDESDDRSEFTKLFREMIMKMLLSEPRLRPNARDLDILFIDILVTTQPKYEGRGKPEVLVSLDQASAILFSRPEGIRATQSLNDALLRIRSANSFTSSNAVE